ncbi:MAG: Spy/CpxP family protein refolding chaperone [Xanthobacteraceae bacterium]|nr:Spy/CpxP family protein refolding chaperone [Xanthobacteraceae bacterium]
MKTPFLYALAFGASLSFATVVPPALAQGQQQQQSQDQADQEKEASPSDKAAFLNARIAALKAVLALTPDQEKLWGPFETALRDTHKESEDRAQKMHSAAEPNTVFEMLNSVADHEIARAQALKKLVAAAQPLVASLTPEQKRRIPAFIGLGESDHGPSSGDLWIFEEEED